MRRGGPRSAKLSDRRAGSEGRHAQRIPVVLLDQTVDEQRGLLAGRHVSQARHASRAESQRAFDFFRGDAAAPCAAVRDDAEIDAVIRESAESAYHPCGTYRMGDDPMSVIDPQCRVHATADLHMVGNSVMPSVVSGNLNAPTTMIGEKASDMNLGRIPPLRPPMSGTSALQDRRARPPDYPASQWKDAEGQTPDRYEVDRDQRAFLGKQHDDRVVGVIAAHVDELDLIAPSSGVMRSEKVMSGIAVGRRSPTIVAWALSWAITVVVSAKTSPPELWSA